MLACVSYPGYDNNRLANAMDSEYYNKLVTDSARPFYNNATQEKTAPGSTYKPLTAIAGISEGLITTDTEFPCYGIYKKVSPNPKCWAYPSAHGNVSPSQAIEHSCNSFFYEVGYRLSLKAAGLEKLDSDNAKGEATSPYYSSNLGTDTLKKYAVLFGFGNNYTTSQIARYVTAVANKGTVYNLTLLDKVTSEDGETIKEYNAEVKNTLSDVSTSTWTAIHEGMRNVVAVEHNRDIFQDLNRSGLELSGKTGTAQQSKTHPNHGLFVGFAPSSSPEVAFAIRIANGYSSSRAAEVGRDVMKYYYDIAPEEEIITGKAAEVGTSSGGD